MTKAQHKMTDRVPRKKGKLVGIREVTFKGKLVGIREVTFKA